MYVCMERKRFYTTRELAELFNVSQETIRKMIRDGVIKAIKLHKKKFLIPAEEVEKLLKQLRESEGVEISN